MKSRHFRKDDAPFSRVSRHTLLFGLCLLAAMGMTLFTAAGGG